MSEIREPYMLKAGDCKQLLKGLPDNSIGYHSHPRRKKRFCGSLKVSAAKERIEQEYRQISMLIPLTAN